MFNEEKLKSIKDKDESSKVLCWDILNNHIKVVSFEILNKQGAEAHEEKQDNNGVARFSSNIPC